MEPKKPLSYLASQCVLQYMEANQRIELTQRCPSLKALDKLTPLSIDYLLLSGSSITLNNYIHNIGVHRQYPKDTPVMFRRHEEENRKGGIKYDLDEFGHWERSWFKPHFPGDIEVKSCLSLNLGDVTPEEEQEQYAAVEEEVKQLKSHGKNKNRQKEIDTMESYLYSWHLKRQNIPAPFTMYLQYTHKMGSEIIKIEYLEYKKKTYDALKYLCNSLFSERKHPLKVNELRITELGGVLRVPESLRISARKIHTGSNFGPILKSIEHLLVHQNFEQVRLITGKSLALNYDHPAIRSAEYFGICNIPTTGDHFHIVLNDRHKWLCVMNPEMTSEEYTWLVQKLKVDRREIGTKLVFGVASKTIVKALFADIKLLDGATFGKEKDRGCSRFPNTYSIPIDAFSKLSIYCDRYTGNEEYTPWCLRISVEEKKKNDNDK